MMVKLNKFSWYVGLFIFFVILSCVSSPDRTEEKTLTEGITLFNKAEGFLEIDPIKALEYYIEANVFFKTFIKENPGNAALVAEAKEYINNAEFGIDFIHALEKYEKMDIDELLESGHTDVITMYKEEYGELLVILNRSKEVHYLEDESEKIIKKITNDLDMIRKKEIDDITRGKSLDCYHNGCNHFTKAEEYYTEWYNTKDNTNAGKAIEAYEKAIKEFNKVDKKVTPQEYEEALLKIESARAAVSEIKNYKIEEPENQSPIAKAGEDQTVETGKRVTLNGSSSYDPDNDTLRFIWSQVSGPKAELSNTGSAKTGFTAKEPGTYVFQLKVSDGKLESTDTVTITAKHPATPVPEKTAIKETRTPEPVNEVDTKSAIDLGFLTHNGTRGDLFILCNYSLNEKYDKNTKVIRQKNINRGEEKRYLITVKNTGDLEILVPAGYSIESAGFTIDQELKRFENDPTLYKRYIRLLIKGSSRIIVTVKRSSGSPDDYKIMFKLYPR
ncbi:MAG: PKD domain-containing protein [Spirochaetales bacterium]|nr:PKD domain-containing protein [Spirochaetales bacterium]